MSRLCIVSRDSPTLPGYLMVVLDKEIKSPDGLDLIFDRRQAPPAPRPSSAERRRSPGIDQDLRTRGFALIGVELPDSSRRSWDPKGWRRRAAPLRMPSVRMPSLRMPTIRVPRVRISRRASLASLAIAALLGGGAAAIYAVLTITPEERTRLVGSIASLKRAAEDLMPVPERHSASPTRAPSPAVAPRGVDSSTGPALSDTRSSGQSDTAEDRRASASPAPAPTTASQQREPTPPSRGAAAVPDTARTLPPAPARPEPAPRRDSTPGQEPAAGPNGAARQSPDAVRPDSPRRESQRGDSQTPDSQRQDPAVRREPPAPSREAPAVTLPPARHESPSLTLPPVRRDPASPTAATRSETAAASASLRESSPALAGSEDAARSQARRGAAPGAGAGGSQPEPTASAPAGRPRSARAGGPPRVELDVQPAGNDAQRSITYTARLWDANGRPLQNANVTLHGWMPNGSDLETSLGSTPTPGTYRGTATVGPVTPGNLRVRVVHEGARFEIPGR